MITKTICNTLRKMTGKWVDVEHFQLKLFNYSFPGVQTGEQAHRVPSKQGDSAVMNVVAAQVHSHFSVP